MRTPKALALVLALAACGGHASGSRHVVGGGTTAKVKLDPVKPGARRAFERAMSAEHMGGPEADDTAKSRLREAVKEDSSMWEAWYDLGVIAWRGGDDDEAIEDFNKALSIDPNHVSVVLARAEANRRAGKRKDARSDYESALKSMDEDDPNRRDTAARLASLLRDSEQYDDAVDLLRDTVRLSGANAKIYTELGQTYLAQKRLELASLLLAKALELDAKDPAIYNALALLALKQGKAQEAFDLFDKAVSLDPNFMDARFDKASVLLDAGDWQRAKTELGAIVQAKGDDDLPAQIALGVAHRMGKEFPEAKKVWEHVLKVTSKRSQVHADAQYNLAILKLDSLDDASGGKADLASYLQEAPTSHARHQDAENKCKEVKCR